VRLFASEDRETTVNPVFVFWGREKMGGRGGSPEKAPELPFLKSIISKLLFLGCFFGGFLFCRFLDFHCDCFHRVLNRNLGALFDLPSGHLDVFVKSNFPLLIALLDGDVVPVKLQNRARNLVALGRAGQSKRSNTEI
jgi:hypothetical protein